ncbi:hypothetical protein TNCV_432941 [Trichonephila clavipes]|nr:hypothetical protein TNCV_432941 [Trichonephila clavipes]
MSPWNEGKNSTLSLAVNPAVRLITYSRKDSVVSDYTQFYLDLEEANDASQTGSVENKPRPGGPSKLTSRAKRRIVKSATNKPITSAQNIANELLSSYNVSVSAQTVRNVLHSAGLKARTPGKKPYISEVNRKL